MVGIGFVLFVTNGQLGHREATAPTLNRTASAVCTVGGWTATGTPVLSKADALLGVSGVPAGSVWAVGHEASTVPGEGTGGHTLVEQRSGPGLIRVASPTPSGNANLAALRVWSDTSGLAVGWWTDSQLLPRPITEIWDGTAWSMVPFPSPSASNTALYSIDGISSSDAWTVGVVDSPDGTSTLAFAAHWDGSTWQAVPTDPAAENATFDAVRALAPNDVWAVGFEGGPSGITSLAEHWDGTRWTKVPTPQIGANNNLLLGLDGTSGSDVWAVGEYDASQLGPLVMHWDGSNWTIAVTSLPGVTNARLTAVTAASTGDVWAVGSRMIPKSNGIISQGSDLGLITHYDGSGWSVTSNDVTSPIGSTFQDVVSLGTPPEVWLVGTTMSTGLKEVTIAEHICPGQVSDAGFSTSNMSVHQGNAAAWVFSSDTGQSHSVADASGLSLFDSAARLPGTSFTAVVNAAGTYPLRDSFSGAAATLTVPIQLSRLKAGVSQPVAIRWAHAKVGNYVEDVQIKRPRMAAFTDWMSGTLTLSANFTADAGPGAYSFRSRLRDPISAHASGWSPRLTLTVS